MAIGHSMVQGSVQNLKLIHHCQGDRHTHGLHTSLFRPCSVCNSIDCSGQSNGLSRWLILLVPIFVIWKLLIPIAAVLDVGYCGSRRVERVKTPVNDNPANTKHLYNIYTTLAQRRRRWSNIVIILYKCFVFAGNVPRRG